jgi:hypothetical protein
MILPSPTPFPEVRGIHRQLHRNSCSVSAFEFVAKLHGLIPLNSYPLQSDLNNQGKGFSEPDLQSEVGLCAMSDKEDYNTLDALDLLREETSQGRFPIISLRAFLENGEFVGYHINVVVSEADQLMLLEPADGSVRAATTKDLEMELERSCRPILPKIRNTLHILTVRPQNEEG